MATVSLNIGGKQTSDAYILFADLDRVPKKLLKKSDVCAICNNPFLEGNMALVSGGEALAEL